MRILSALLLKDLRAVRGWIVLTWLLAAAAWLSPQRGVLRGDVLGWPSAASSLALVSWLFVALMQRSLLALDPPSGDRRFIATRPASGIAVWGSKMLVILLAGVGPTALAMALRLWGAGLEVTIGEGLLVALENGLLLLCLLGFLTLRHVVPGRSLWIGGLSVFAVMGVLMMSTAQMERALYTPFETFDFFMKSGLAAGFIGWAALAGRYASNWRGWLRFSLVAVAAASILAISSTWSQHHRSASVEASAPVGIHPSFEPRGASWSCSLFSPTSEYVEIRRDMSVKNLPPGVWVEQTLSEGTIQVEGESGAQRFHWETRGMESWNVPPQAAAGALPGSPSLVTPWDSLYLPVARVMLHEVKKDVPFKATLHGRNYFDVCRAELVTVLPIRKGLVWSGHHMRLEVLDILSFSPRQARVRMTGDVFLNQSSMLFRDKLSTGANEYGFYGINRPAETLFLMGGASLGNIDSVLLRRLQTVENWGFGLGGYRWFLPGQTPPLERNGDDDSGIDHQQTQIGIFRRIKIGSVVIPFDYENQLLLPR